MNFCCEDFRFRASLNSYANLNFRIISVENNRFVEPSQSLKLEFFITPGYRENESGVPIIRMVYCPYCGRKLVDFYTEEGYINETNLKFLSED